MIKSIALVALLVIGTHGQGFLGPCPHRETSMRDLDKFSGKWYLMASMGVEVDVLTLKCVEYTLSYDQEKNEMHCVNTALTKDAGVEVHFNSTGIPQSDGSVVMQTDDGMMSAPYYIFGTDYETYSLLSTCIERTVGRQVYHAESAYILTREEYESVDDIPDEINQKVNKDIADVGFTRDGFSGFENTGCNAE